MFQDLLQGAKSLLFPVVCAACGHPLDNSGENPLCPSCLTQLPELPTALCRRCALPLPGPGAGVEICLSCRVNPPAFDGAACSFLYQGGAKTLVTALKYGGRTSLADFLGKQLAHEVRNRLSGLPLQAVVPVPLHPVRQRERTFNQAALLARAAAAELRLPLREEWLVRKRFTRPQTELAREERIRNLRGAFERTADLDPACSGVLLIDDVLTTGATAGACARLLKAGGIRHVAVAAVCRG